ncbi:MAG: hypothetical protein AAGA48_36580 [Myxococcota bacterium]
MGMGMGLGVMTLLWGLGSMPATAKAPKNGKIRAESRLGEDGPRLDDFIVWRAVPVTDAPPAEGEEPAKIELGAGRLDAQIPPGTYILEGEVAPVVQTQQIEVRSGKRLSVQMVFDGAFVEYAPKNVTGAFTCGSTNGKENRSFTATEPTKRFFPPGVWEVSCKRGVLDIGNIVDLKSGNSLRITPDLSSGTVETTLVDGEIYPDEVFFEIRPYDEGLRKSSQPIYVEQSKSLSAPVPPGTYEIFARLAFERPVPDQFSIEGTARGTVSIGDTTQLEIDAPWALVTPKLEIGRRARKPGEARWWIHRAEADDEDKAVAIRLTPEEAPFTLYAYEEPLVIKVHDEFDRIVGTSAPFIPEPHAVTEVTIKIGR